MNLTKFQWLLLAPALVLGGSAMAVQPRPAATAAPTRVIQDYAPRPAIWLLSDADTKIYMFGTIHILPPGFRWRTPKLDAIVAASDELVVETYDDPAKAEDDVTSEDVALMLRPGAKPILKRVPRRSRKAVAEAIAASKIPLRAFDAMHTWAVAFMLGFEQMFGSYGVDSLDEAPGVEDALETDFQAAKKPIASVEDGDAVARELFGQFTALPEKEQMEMLVDAVSSEDEIADASAEDDRLWATGDAEKLMIDAEEDFSPAMYELLIVRRNRAWTQWLKARLDKPGTTLFAVGAGHFAGKDSVQRMLGAQGFKVSRVQ